MNQKWTCSPAPRELGVQALQADIANLVPLIDWKYFLYAWGFPLTLSTLEEDSPRGAEARKLLKDGREFLEQVVGEGLCEARSVIGIFPVRRIGDDAVIAESTKGAPVVHFLRQQVPAASSGVCHSLADYLSPKDRDWLGFFALSAGFGVDERMDDYRKRGDDYHAMLLETLSGRLTEAYSEQLHRDVMHSHWGYAPHREWGIRPAIGYPIAPDHTEKQLLWELLDVENRIGMKLTDSHMMWPLNSACGYYFAHPKSRYFSVGKIGDDQILDYARRKGWTLEYARKILCSNVMDG